MKVSDLLSSKAPPVTIRSGGTIQDAMRALIENEIGSLVVIDREKHPVGIITEKDIFHLAYRFRGDMMDMPVDDHMTGDLFFGSPEDDLEFIGKMMTAQRIRHVPILDGDKCLCGMVSIGDVVKAKSGDTVA